MKTNKTFGTFKGNRTPFHKVHIADSGEIVNELNMPICSAELEDIPRKLRANNSKMLVQVLNNYDPMLQMLKDFVKCLRRFDLGDYSPMMDEIFDAEYIIKEAEIK